MGFEFLEIYRDLTSQVYRCWNSAVLCHNPEAEQEINRLIKTCVNKAITFSKKQHMFRTRIIEMNQYREIHLEKADDLFSGRSGIYGFPAREMGAPPIQKSNAGRANRQGTLYLYLASNKETACAEVQSICGDLVSVATFELDNDLRLADFWDAPDCLNTFSDKDDNQKLVDIVFFQSIIDLFFRPIRRGNEDIYQYSQYIADLLKKLGIHGILYNLSLFTIHLTMMMLTMRFFLIRPMHSVSLNMARYSGVYPSHQNTKASLEIIPATIWKL